MSNQWFRSWHGAPTDPKWLGIARKAGVAPGIVAAVVWALLDRASQATTRGSIAGYDADGLACFMGCETEHVVQIVALMHEKGILENDAWTGWERHQPAREDGSAERAKAWRERKRTQVNTPEPAQTLDTDTDTDTDTEQERESLSRDPEHSGKVINLLDNHAAMLTDWETKFLISIKWAPTLTASQAESLRTIEARLATKEGATKPLPVIATRGTQAYEAWIAYYRRQSKTGRSFHEKLDSFAVPSEFPPMEKAA